MCVASQPLATTSSQCLKRGCPDFQAQTAEMRATVAGMKETVAALHTDELRSTLSELRDSIQNLGQKSDGDDGIISKADLRRELRSFATTLNEYAPPTHPLTQPPTHPLLH